MSDVTKIKENFEKTSMNIVFGFDSKKTDWKKETFEEMVIRVAKDPKRKDLSPEEFKVTYEMEFEDFRVVYDDLVENHPEKLL